MRIAVYTITKNEAQFISRWAESCADADYRLIVDTGSIDNTVAEARAHGCSVANILVNPWRFDDARNAALSLLPADIDYCIALDADEVLMPGWRQAMEQLDPSVTRPRYKYVWSWKPDGTEGLVYSGDKIHARTGYRWRHPVHEVVTPVGNEVQGWVGLEIHHYPDNSKSRSQYLPLLELAVTEAPNDDRNNFYLGREYMFNRRNEDAARHLKKHLELSTWSAERATAMRYLSRVTDDREGWLMKACAEAPNRREPWVELAQYHYGLKSWSMCLSACEKALEIRDKPLEYLCEEDAWGSLPHDLASVAAWNIGAQRKAVIHSEMAVSLGAGDERLRENCALLHRLTRSSRVDVVVPFKSNIDGLMNLLASLAGNSSIASVRVIADGDEAAKRLQSMVLPFDISATIVPPGSGIHVMWNTGLAQATDGNHVALINDDVVLGNQAMDSLCGYLDIHLDYGIICPNYDLRQPRTVIQDTLSTARGRYDGTGGLAGFCMVLRSDLAQQWRFDERMKWWYGDDDILNWVVRTMGKRSGIYLLAGCSENSSWTISNDPPDDFNKIVENDRKIFLSKWGG